MSNRPASLVAHALTCGIAAVGMACGGGNDQASTTRAPSHAEGPATRAATRAAAPAGSGLASNEGAIIVGDHAIIRQGAVGPLRVGEWRRPVMSFVYVVSARSERDSVSIIVVRGIGKDTVMLAFTNDTLRRILVTHAGPRTSDGIQIGTPFATVAQRADATTATLGKAQVASLRGLCGVKFATDSAALTKDSIVRRATAGPAIVRAIAVDSCKR